MDAVTDATLRQEIDRIRISLVRVSNYINHVENRLNELNDELAIVRIRTADALRDLEYDLDTIKRTVSKLERERR